MCCMWHFMSYGSIESEKDNSEGIRSIGRQTSGKEARSGRQYNGRTTPFLARAHNIWCVSSSRSQEGTILWFLFQYFGSKQVWFLLSELLMINWIFLCNLFNQSFCRLKYCCHEWTGRETIGQIENIHCNLYQNENQSQY